MGQNRKSNDDLKIQHLSTRVIKGHLLYMQKNFPSVDMYQVCSKIGLDYEYLLDETNWVSSDFAKAFTDELILITGKPELPYLVGCESMSDEALGWVFSTFLKFFYTTEDHYRLMPRTI